MISQRFVRRTAMVLGLLSIGWSVSATAQEGEQRRTRVGLGPQLVPSFPGSDDVSLSPLIEFSRARGDEPFAFEAPDDSFGFALLRASGFSIGPALSFESERDAEDVGAALPEVDFTFEAGAFVQYELSPAFRLRAEGRKGIGGHEGLIGTVGADYVARDADNWLFSIGPRLTLADDRYHRAYFGVAPADSAASGLAAYAPEGGIMAAGATAGFLYQFTPRWGIYSYAKYDRLLGDAARSPIVRNLGSRDQFSGGLALTYTFGAR